MSHRSTWSAEALADLNAQHADMVSRIAEHGYGSVEGFFHIVGSASKLDAFRAALDGARPVTYSQMRAFCAGFLSGIGGWFGERAISDLADLAYAESPWRISAGLDLAEAAE